MKKIYEAWENNDDCEITFAPVENIKHQFDNGLMSQEAKLLYQIKADTWEQAMSSHYKKMNWGQYIPEGEPEDCPNTCGAIFYPKGSGECSNCGRIC